MGERVAEVKKNGVGSGISFFQIRRRRGVAGTRGTLAPTEVKQGTDTVDNFKAKIFD